MILLVVHEAKTEGKMPQYKCVNQHESNRLTRIYQQSAKVPEIGSKIGNKNCYQKRVQTSIYF